MTTNAGSGSSQGKQAGASFSDSVSAADTSIGFEYQYYYYLDRLINLRGGESVGLEVKDDVHSDLAGGYCILVQLKHTVQKNAAGAPINLTELDSDLWKTLHNWSKIICDPTQYRDRPENQKKYINQTEFHLVTNKSHTSSNRFLTSVLDYQDSLVTIDELRATIELLEQKTNNTDLKAYIQTVLDLNSDVLAQFLLKLRFETGIDNIISRVKQSIREKFVDEEKIEEVFARLDSNIRADNFEDTRKGISLQITFEEFKQRYQKLFDDARTKKLHYKPFDVSIPQDLFAQTFVLRLLEIGAIDASDVESAVEFTLAKLRLVVQLDTWKQQGQVVTDDISSLHENVVMRWKNEFRAAFRKCNTEDEIVDAANAMLERLRVESFKLDAHELPLELSNGELYHLSDIARIGWHKDWKLK